MPRVGCNCLQGTWLLKTPLDVPSRPALPKLLVAGVNAWRFLHYLHDTLLCTDLRIFRITLKHDGYGSCRRSVGT